MTFLKKLGQALLKGLQIAMGVGPIITPFLGSGKAGQVAQVVNNDLTSIGQVVLQIETAFAAIPNSTGVQKLQAVIPLVKNIVATSELVAGKKIQNEQLFDQAVQEFAQATVDLLNSIHGDEVKSA